MYALNILKKFYLGTDQGLLKWKVRDLLLNNYADGITLLRIVTPLFSTDKAMSEYVAMSPAKLTGYISHVATG